MDCPEAYAKHSLLQKYGTTEMLENYLHLVKWKENANILDLGCGDGSTTMDILEPMLPNDYDKLIGADLQHEMVNYAKKRNRKPKVGFCQFDICGNKLLENQFDHVFSFFAFHWVDDLGKGFRNVFDLLKPGGDMLISVVTFCPFYTYLGRMREHPKWIKYFKDSKVPPFHAWHNQEDTIKNHLEDAKFTDIKMIVEDKEFYYENWADCLKCLLAIDPVISHLTMDQKMDYIIDFHNELRDIFSSIGNLTGKVMMPYNLLIMHAKKPL